MAKVNRATQYDSSYGFTIESSWFTHKAVFRDQELWKRENQGWFLGFDLNNDVGDGFE